MLLRHESFRVLSSNRCVQKVGWSGLQAWAINLGRNFSDAGALLPSEFSPQAFRGRVLAQGAFSEDVCCPARRVAVLGGA